MKTVSNILESNFIIKAKAKQIAELYFEESKEINPETLSILIESVITKTDTLRFLNDNEQLRRQSLSLNLKK